MTTLEIILMVLLWIAFGAFAIYKQKEADDNLVEGCGLVLFLTAPIVLIVVVIKQLFFRKWD